LSSISPFGLIEPGIPKLGVHDHKYPVKFAPVYGTDV
jgi:hypothetical protein